MSTTEVAKPKPEKLTITQVLGGDTFKKQVAMALPKHVTADRFARFALTAMRRTPKLLECSQESVLNCMMQLSQFGLEPDGRRAHLIPYKQECTLIIDYKGYVELAIRSGLVSTIHADVVRRGDIFEYSLGKITKHVPWFLRDDDKKPKHEGEIYAVYAMCENKDGTSASAVMSKDEIEKIRKRSRAGGNGPWVTDWEEMAKKSAFRRLSKWLVLSPEFRDAVQFEEEQEPIEEPQKPNLKLSELSSDPIETTAKNIDESQASEPVSKISECLELLDNTAMDQSLRMSWTGKNDAGHMMYKLGNGKVLTIGDGATGEGSIDTMEPDCVEQVKTELQAAGKKR